MLGDRIESSKYQRMPPVCATPQENGRTGRPSRGETRGQPYPEQNSNILKHFSSKIGKVMNFIRATDYQTMMMS